MARRPSLKVQIPDEVFTWFVEQKNEHATARSCLAVAALAAFRACNPERQKTMLRWADIMIEGDLSWSDFERVCDEEDEFEGEVLREGLERGVFRKLEEARQSDRAQA